jgi:hypothetical protein
MTQEWLPVERDKWGTVLQPSPALMAEHNMLKNVFFCYRPGNGTWKDPECYAFSGWFRLVTSSHLVRYSGHMATEDWLSKYGEHLFAEFYTIALLPRDGPPDWKIKGLIGSSHTWLEERTSAELALALAPTLPAESFEQLGWKNNPAWLADQWKHIVQKQKSYQATLDGFEQVGNDFLTRISSRYPQLAAELMAEARKLLGWAVNVSLSDTDRLLGKLMVSLNTLAGSLVDPALLPVDSGNMGEWFRDNWQISTGSTLRRAEVSPALAALLNEKELMALGRQVGPDRARKIIVGRDRYLEQHPTAIIAPNT